ncbi:MAG TPA: hypothetical protein PK605_02990 [Ignavibacteria bacterium]|nr:hypothetical protein [Ignavibacteria bacterium]HRF65618.1 hypothetical protein [Ignavibacteria bacterium]HRJ03350.1 hypothetical protein [Ignavibacteria bacterium]HRJ86491.1 hypothetical protein [Ignavibacteria bacterium]
MEGSTLYFVVLVPLAIIIMLALIFYRLFNKNMKRDEEEMKKLKELDDIKRKAEFRSARIVNVRAEPQSHTSPSFRFANIRFEIKDDSGEFKLLTARWNVDTYYLSSLQPDTNIQVKVYDELVFPVSDDARLYPD